MVFAVATKALIVKEGSVLRLWKSDSESAVSIAPNERWDLPGGRLQPGESPIESLQREIREETSLEVRILGPGFVWHRYFEEKKFQLVGITFVCRYVGGEIQLSEEHSHFEWTPLSRLHRSGWADSELVASSIRLYVPGTALS